MLERMRNIRMNFLGKPAEGSAPKQYRVPTSLSASILNVKYVNSSALHRVEQEFERNGISIFRQTMSNWIIKCADRYFAPFVERMKEELLSLHVTQADETPTQVIQDRSHPNSKCYMWVHRSSEF